jgi:nephrocystin-4
MDMEPTTAYGNPAAFAGAAAPPGGGGGAAAPSRVLLQQLYDAGMVDALPADVQVCLCAFWRIGAAEWVINMCILTGWTY